MRYYLKFRIFLLMLGLGLASFQFFSYIHEKWNEVNVDLPQVSSETPIFITPKPTLSKEFIYKKSLISKDRDLSQFENGGTFTNQCWSQDDEKNCEKKRIEARKFILKHLKEKKRGYIIYTAVGSDCINDLHFFIQPNENGEWQIVEVMEMSGIFYFGEDNLELSIYTSAKLKRATKDDFPFEFGTYYLSLIDENGEENYAL